MIFSFIRISTALSVCGTIFPPGTPNTFKVLLCLMLSGLTSINLGIEVPVDNMYMFITYATTEFINGLFLGYVTYLAFSCVQIAGSLIDLQMGLSMASLYDPATGTQTTLMQKLFQLLASTLFFITDGHHLLIGAIIKSFEMIPIGTVPIVNNIEYILSLFIEYFALGFQIALPILLTLILSDLILGLISRSVPQLNVMIIGLPLKLLVGIIIVFASLPFIVAVFEKIMIDLPRILTGFA